MRLPRPTTAGHLAARIARLPLLSHGWGKSGTRNRSEHPPLTDGFIRTAVVSHFEIRRAVSVSHRRMQANAKDPPKKPHIPPFSYSSCWPIRPPKMPQASNPKTHMPILLAKIVPASGSVYWIEGHPSPLILRQSWYSGLCPLSRGTHGGIDRDSLLQSALRSFPKRPSSRPGAGNTLEICSQKCVHVQKSKATKERWGFAPVL